jgi:transcriptional regulator with XRE-family HTH domain
MKLQLKKLDQRRAKLGMSRPALSHRAKVSLPTVTRILSGKEANPTIDTLHAIAQALGVVVSVGAEVKIEERESADDFRTQQAKRKATELVKMVQGTMALEAQAVEQTAVERMINQTTYELLNSRRRLWSE